MQRTGETEETRRWSPRLRVPFRRTAHNASDAAGMTIVGDSMLPAAGADGAVTTQAPHADVIDAEGAAPALVSDVRGDAVTAWLFQPDHEPVAVRLSDLPALAAVEDTFVWVDLAAYTEADLHEVGRVLRLHRKAVHAALSPWQRPRLAVYGDHFFTSATVAGSH